ncbi:hypothetical protein EG329_009849 [Mollisiaceae sp. DMI_Dod_QoI]|nr:hypothetical protein EG329_009849 [Helotiales sp. DMI_Dod_QoI]
MARNSSYYSDEEAPLLSSPESPTTSSFPRSPRPTFGSRTSSYIHHHQTHSPRVITAIILLVLFILSFGSYLMTVPGLRIYEDIICHHYYDRIQGVGHVGLEGEIDESMCKGDEVQKELSIVMAGLLVVGAIPSLVMTIPYGLLADRIGRKPVFMLAIIGLVLCALWQMIVMWFWRTLPLRLLWLGPILTLIGGGEAVAAMTFYAIVCDITLEANRANVFLLGISAGLVAQLFAPSVTVFLMKTSNWIPILLGTSILIIGTLLMLLIPETLHMRPRPSNPSHLTPAVSHLDLNDSSASNIATKTPTSLLNAIRSEFASSLRSLTSSTSILRSTPIILLVLTFAIQPFTNQSLDLSLRYMSTRFHFPLRLSSLLLSLRAGVNILLLLVILPALSYFLTNRLHFLSPQKDLYLARASVLVLTIGAFLVALSPTLPLTVIGMAIFTLGTGYTALARSLATTLVEREHIGQLYALIAVVEVVGALIAGPSLAQFYIVGLRWKGAWVGLPFFGVAVICAVAILGIWTAGWIIQKEGWGRDETKAGGEEEEGEDAVLLGVERDVDVSETDE